MRFRPPLCVLSIALLGLGNATAGQNDVLRINTRLVEVDVVVRGAGGPITNLSKEDFTVADNGKTQRVDVFSVSTEERSKAKDTLPPLASGVVSNRTGREVPHNATVILFDRLNTADQFQRDGRKHLISYLKSTTREDFTAIYVLGDGLKLVQDFTNDADRLLRAATKMEVGDLPGVENRTVPEIVQSTAVGRATRRDVRIAVAEVQQSVLQRTDPTEDAIELIARHLNALPGRKSLIWMSAAGIPLSISSGSSRDGRESQLGHITRVLSNANIAVYPVDLRGLQADPPRGRRGMPSTPPPDVMLRLADETGGRAFYFNNDLAGSIRTAISDAEVTYTLGFYPSDDAFDGKFHKLEVKVARANVQVLHRAGYFAINEQAPDEKERRSIIAELMSSPLDASRIGLQASVQPDKTNAKAFRLLLRIDPADLRLEMRNDRWNGIVDVAVRVEPTKEKTVQVHTYTIDLAEADFREALARGLGLADTVITDRSIDRVRVVVQDRATGFAGSLSLPVR
jgi:VWFA-related protein